ncbi:MAG: hypothetical protein MZW92_24780 [Comamonadaceae bacterium]|nr:hypothetical protein [Comamonadaceae bacterium]
MIELDGTANKGKLGANAILGRLDGRGPGGGASAADLPLYALPRRRRAPRGCPSR